MLELTEEQRQALDQHPDTPVEVIDPRTRQIYLLVPAAHYPRQHGPAEGSRDRTPFELPPEIGRARAAFRRGLPQLLQNANLRGKYVAYAGDERIAIADDDAPLIRECLRRGIADDHYYIGVIEPAAANEEEVGYGLLEAEEVEPGPPTDHASC